MKLREREREREREKERERGRERDRERGRERQTERDRERDRETLLNETNRQGAQEAARRWNRSAHIIMQWNWKQITFRCLEVETGKIAS